MTKIDVKHPASFRDPAGFVFRRNGILYRQINSSGADFYTRLMASGLYDSLISRKLMIAHEEVTNIAPVDPTSCFRIIRPEQLKNVSYPYEWCFSQYRDAALSTLAIQSAALNYGMSLRDASVYNVQFLDGKPVFIDTLSFEPYQPGNPWVAYQQFCRHFLAPLALMSKVSIYLNCLMRDFIDGIPLSVASKMLPWRTRFSLPLFFHVHMHARAQKRFANNAGKRTIKNSFGSKALHGLLDNLRSGIRKLRWSPEGTQWSDYYSDTNYTDEAVYSKKAITKKYIELIGPDTVWDFGANTGYYSRIAADLGVRTVCFDADPGAVERNYLMCKDEGRKNILPLVLDLTNPSPCLGWRSMEREGILQRGPVDMALMLALVHHLAIGNNIPFLEIAGFLAEVAKYGIVEFVPKSDSQVQRLLANRKDIFITYTQQHFESAFSRHFEILHSELISGSERRLYLMCRKKYSA